MNSGNGNDVKIDLHLAEGGWRVTIERDGRRRDLHGIEELIRFLEALAAAQPQPVRGLR